MLAQGLLAVEGEYGMLALTPTSGDVMRGQRPVMLRREPERPGRAARAAKKASVGADMPAAAAPVFEALRTWRAGAAKEQGVPAYVVFHDATLRQIATLTPTSLEALGRVNGVGDAKLARYGQQILDTLEQLS